MPLPGLKLCPPSRLIATPVSVVASTVCGDVGSRAMSRAVSAARCCQLSPPSVLTSSRPLELYPKIVLDDVVRERKSTSALSDTGSSCGRHPG